MNIAKLRVSIINQEIRFNSSAELGTDKSRGTVLPNGEIIRGLGTHFASQAAKERFDRLTSEANRIRDAFNHNFVKLGIADAFYVITNKGDAERFLSNLTIDPEVDARVTELDLGATTGGLDAQEMAEWGLTVKTQIERVQLGRGKDIKPNGLAALEALSKCPALSKETGEAIRTLVAEARLGTLSKPDLQRSIELLDVKMDQSVLQIGARQIIV